MEVITIGRLATNNLVLNNPNVSKNHAVLTKIGPLDYIVEDLNSTNGTLVNGVLITKKTKVAPTDIITIADEVINWEKDLGVKVPTNFGNDYSDEFDKLKTVYGNYTNNKLRLSKNFNNKNAAIRAGFMLMPLVIYYGFGLDKNPDLANKYILFSTFFTMFAQFIKIGEKDYQDKVDALNTELQLRWVCPSCANPLPSSNFEVCKKQRKFCMQCKCKW
jgi:hypothetical protein